MLPTGDNTHSNLSDILFINIIVYFHKKDTETRMINLTIYKGKITEVIVVSVQCPKCMYYSNG